jgi:hypothetical protein
LWLAASGSSRNTRAVPTIQCKLHSICYVFVKMTEQFAVVRRLRPAVYLVHRYRQINQNDNGYFLANLSFLSLAGYNGSMFFFLNHSTSDTDFLWRNECEICIAQFIIYFQCYSFGTEYCEFFETLKLQI